MAYLVTHFWPGATMEQYKTTVGALWPPNGLPDGEIWHAAGATEGGVLIAAVWESEEHFDRFLTDTVMPSMPVENGLTRYVKFQANVVTAFMVMSFKEK